VKTKVTANNIFKFLDRKLEDEIRVIHANKGQNSRINAIEAFKQDEVRVLVTTDVTARGIDVSDISHGINFDVPLIYEDYVHRIGRTGRAGASGEAISLVSTEERTYLRDIEKLVGMRIPNERLEGFEPNEQAIEELPKPQHRQERNPSSSNNNRNRNRSRNYRPKRNNDKRSDRGH